MDRLARTVVFLSAALIALGGGVFGAWVLFYAMNPNVDDQDKTLVLAPRLALIFRPRSSERLASRQRVMHLHSIRFQG